MSRRSKPLSESNMVISKVATRSKMQTAEQTNLEIPSTSSKSRIHVKRKREVEKIEASPNNKVPVKSAVKSKRNVQENKETSTVCAKNTNRMPKRVIKSKRTLRVAEEISANLKEMSQNATSSEKTRTRVSNKLTIKTTQETSADFQGISATASTIPRPVVKNKRKVQRKDETSADSRGGPETASSSKKSRSVPTNKPKTQATKRTLNIIEKLSTSPCSKKPRAVTKKILTRQETRFTSLDCQEMSSSARSNTNIKAVAKRKQQAGKVLDVSTDPGKKGARKKKPINAETKQRKLISNAAASADVQESSTSTSAVRTRKPVTRRSQVLETEDISTDIQEKPSGAISRNRKKVSKTKRSQKVADVDISSVDRPSKRQRTDEKKSCAICLDTVRNSTMRSTACQHWFHNKCLNDWLERASTCPTCRFVLKETATPVQPVSSSNIEFLPGGVVHVRFNFDVYSGIVTIM